MKTEWFKEYSDCLLRDMEFKVYGHAGTPILVFPSQNGRFFDFENNGMVHTVEHLIDEEEFSFSAVIALIRNLGLLKGEIIAIALI